MIFKLIENFNISKTRFGNSLRFRGRNEKYLFQLLGFSKKHMKMNILSIEDLESAFDSDLITNFKNLFSDKLNIKTINNIKFGKKILLEMTDSSINDLFNNSFILNFDPIRRRDILVTYDIKKIIQYRNRNTNLELQLVSKIEFQKFYSELIEFRKFLNASENWLKTLTICLLDAYNLDVKEVYLGFGQPEIYQYVVGGSKIEGKIDNRVVSELSKLVEKTLDPEIIFKKIFPFGLGKCFKLNTLKNNGINIIFNKCNKVEILSSVKKFDSEKSQSAQIKHILLIDDDSRFVELLKKVISTKGYKVSIAVSVNDALLYYLDNDNTIDLVITDLHLPNCNGIDLINALKAKNYTFPIIVLTSDVEADSHLNVINAGADILIKKEEDPKVLLAWMNKLLYQGSDSETYIN
jgi:CheY-like chemotaxis protein